MTRAEFEEWIENKLQGIDEKVSALLMKTGVRPFEAFACVGIRKDQYNAAWGQKLSGIGDLR